MLFTDIVDSTPLAASMGEERWSALIEDHNDRMHQHVAAHEGHEVKHTGDGFLVAFDDTDSAVRCALAAMAAVAGSWVWCSAPAIHVGEVARMEKNDFSGIAVHFAQRLCARAESGQLLTSADVRSGCDGRSDCLRRTWPGHAQRHPGKVGDLRGPPLSDVWVAHWLFRAGAVA